MHEAQGFCGNISRLRARALSNAPVKFQLALDDFLKSL